MIIKILLSRFVFWHFENVIYVPSPPLPLHCGGNPGIGGGEGLIFGIWQEKFLEEIQIDRKSSAMDFLSTPPAISEASPVQSMNEFTGVDCRSEGICIVSIGLC
ncbi:hypothetical protein HAX54_041952 [Datura stramonium]|uniref:Uncharacterized protein n=1 Tax=Datura stramonium TaxID=4076 RepID=A0ABS8SMV4_DATST|nr:hypothetical protein [Datura stramonium]